MKEHQNIHRKRKNYIIGLKELLNWMFNNHRVQEDLEQIIKKYQFDISLFKRLTSYVYNSPHLIWYINKYLNELYNFNSFDLIDLIYSYTYLFEIHHKNQSKKLFHIKSDDLADKHKKKVKELLNQYFTKIYDKKYSDSELNFFYDLFTLDVISVNDIKKIDNHLNGLDSNNNSIDISELELYKTINLQNKTNQSYSILDINRSLSEEIIKFCNKIKAKIIDRPECKKCELYGKPCVILDTNLEEPGPVDIFFVGLNPGKDEVKFDKPFVGKSGLFLRQKIAKIENIKWVITNVILCHTRNEKDIRNPDDVIERCRQLVAEIASAFPSKIYVPLGSKAAKSMQLTDNITQISGKKFVSEYYTIIPLIHPSSAVNYGQIDKFNENFKTIYDIFKTKEEVKKKDEQVIESSIESEDLTLFDIKELNEKILKIFIDKNGRKRYILEDNIFTFYVKLGTWKECSQIEDKVDLKVIIPGHLKSAILKRVKDTLNQAKEIV